jgi:signal peptidase II
MKKWTWMFWLLPIAVLIALDQAIKIFISANRNVYSDLEVIPDFFYITYLENRGAAFSIMQDMRWVLVAVTLIAVVVMARFFLKFKGFWARLPLSLLLAGAIGNLIDRARQGFVVDYLHFYPFGYNFPVFNLADICVDVGALFLAIWLLFLYREPGVVKYEKEK